MRACVLLKDTPHYRKDAFVSGLQAQGFKVFSNRTFDPTPEDCLLIWNRYGHGDQQAKKFEAVGARVYVAENCYLGNDWQGKQWYTISLNHHNIGNTIRHYPCWKYDWPIEAWGDYPEGEIILLPQRGIGPEGVRMPDDWLNRTIKKLNAKKIPHRVRKHPGITKCKPLFDDLCEARAVITWGSGAGLKAMIAGIPVISDFTRWIGYDACTPMADFLSTNELHFPDRFPVLDKIAMSIFTIDEIAGGEWCAS